MIKHPRTPSTRPVDNQPARGRRDRAATLPEYALILAGLVVATVVGAQVLEAGADQNTDHAAEAIGRMCHVDIYLDCVDGSFATTTIAPTTTTTIPILGSTTSTSTSTTSTSTTSSSTTTAPSTTSSTSTSTTTPPSSTSTSTSTTSTSTSTSTSTTSTSTSTTSTTTVPVEKSRLIVQKRPRLRDTLWQPRARFWVEDESGNRISGAQISATITYLKPDGSVHATVTGDCTTSGSFDRCGINLGLYVSRDITTVWNVTVDATPEWDGSNSEFTMTWQD